MTLTSEPSADEYGLTELWNEVEYRACRTDSQIPREQLEAFEHFCSNYVYIRHPEGGRIQFDLYDAQREAVLTFMANRQVIVLKARQIGFSTILAVYVLWCAAFYRDRQIILISIGEREAIKLLQKVKYSYRFLPDWMKERIGPINSTQQRLTFDGMSSEIESIPSSQPARGDSAWLIICDELAHLKNAEEAYTAIEPAADVGGRVIMNSTAFGEGNLFHRLWVGAEAGTNNYTPMFFGWDAAPSRDQDWYDAKVASDDMDDAKMAQEYPTNPEDAFLKSGRPVFNLAGLRQLEIRDPIARGYFDNGDFVRDDDLSEGFTIWEPPSADEVYAIGVDVAQGLEHGDFSSVHVIACRKRKMVATYHAHVEPDILGREILPALGRWYNQALIGVESNSFGLVTLKYLANEAKYHPIYYERSPKYKNSVPTDVLGFRTTQTTKPLIIGELKEALRTREVIVDDETTEYVSELDMPCEKTLQELKTFVLDGKGKMEGSPYDDRTMSLAIANHMRKFVFHDEFKVDHGPKPGTFGWWEKRLYGESFTELTSDQGPVRVGKGPPRKPFGQNYVRSRSKFTV